MEKPRILIPLPISNLKSEGIITSKSFHKLQREGFQPLVATVTMRPSEIKSLYNKVDGVVFPGGSDIDPQLYGQRTHSAAGEINREQDRFELELAKRLLDDEKPTLGICRGAQMLAIANGGELFQHIPDITKEPHGVSIDVEGESSFHDIVVFENTQAHNIFGTNRLRSIISRHHQAIASPGKMQTSGESPERIIEIIENPTHPFYFGIQPHLELLQPSDMAYRNTSDLFNAYKDAVLIYVGQSKN